MFNKLKPVLLSVIMISIPCFSHASGWVTDDGTAIIKFVNSEGSLIRFHYTANETNNPDNCGTVNSVVLLPDNPMFDQHYSLLLSAFMAKKKMKIFTNGCKSAWGTSLPIVSALYVYD